MAGKDIRWIQRFSNYRRALARLTFAINLSIEKELSELEQQGLIQAFEFTFDMATKTMLDFIVEKGYSGERDKPLRIIVDAAQRGFISEPAWRAMYKSRNKTSHTYDEAIAETVFTDIVNSHFALLIQLETRFQLEKLNQENNG